MPGRPAIELSNKSDGALQINYLSNEIGVHEVLVSHNDKPVEGSPLRMYVDKAGSGYVCAHGEGLNQGASGHEVSFFVTGSAGDVKVTVEGPSQAQVARKEGGGGGGGGAEYVFTPATPGEYVINVTAKGKHVHGSPFSCKVSGEGRKRSQHSITATSQVKLGGSDVNLAGMVGTLTLPDGSKEACLLCRTSDGALGIASFQPKARGKYVVNVTMDAGKFPGSPFTIDVGDGQIASPSKVKVSGVTGNGKANDWNAIDFDFSAAGHGTLSFSVEGSHRTDIASEDKGSKKFTVKYKPHEPGLYMINARFADEHITGSPFMVSVGGQQSGRIRETVVKKISKAEVNGPGSLCEFHLKIPGTDPLDMEAQLSTPSGKTSLCEILDLDERLYHIKFKPEEEGVHTVSLKCKGLHISGSPFQYTVGNPPCQGAYRVEVGGPGLEFGEVGEKMDFNIYTREAGAGELSVAIEGPSKAKMEVVDRGHGYTTVTYEVTKPGAYGIHIKYDDEHVPDSPSMLYVCPESKDAKKVELRGFQSKGMEPGRPVGINVCLNGARGELSGKVDQPDGTEGDLLIQELDCDVSALRFLPTQNGVYFMHVKFQEAHIPGSPFPMLIGKLGCDAARVTSKGDGLTKGESGKSCVFNVLTLNAGAGTLAVFIEGPSKVAIMCKENESGYEFTYTPTAPGNYMINIKFSNVTIAGCPSRAVITGAGKPLAIAETSSLSVETVEKKPGVSNKKRFSGDASKVQAAGNGLKKCFANRPATFTVDVKDAGNALLTVGLITPSGSGPEELTTKKTRPTVYSVSFKTKEKGEHTLSVKWGADDVPGSPFHLVVA